MRRYLRADAVALGVVGVVALTRVVAGITPGMDTREWGVSVALLPPEVWGMGWLLAAVVCFVAMGVGRLRSVAVGLASFMLTAWGINWLLVLREDVDAYRQQVTGLGERVESLEGDVRSLRVKYSGALGYIGVLQGYVPAESEPPAPPVSIRDDLQD